MSDKALTADVEVIDNPKKNRYEAWVNTGLAGFARYSRKPTRITFVHTEVNPAYAGHGVATALARTSLDAARAQGLTVRAVCPFYAAWIAQHPEYQDLLSPGVGHPAG
ncbi:GNAT family N-acetyltransferase [Actinomadura sp. 6N118]|uniref:GNAT family N-acetyltransferase n=1 Tax=Actinomadura sp. 6N118 TaxID=3375151 RepID=UPI00378E376C